MSPPGERPRPEDLRTSTRAPIRLRVDYERMNSFFADYTSNLSKGGTFIKTTLQLEGEVAWVLPVEAADARGEEPGMGVRFLFKDRVAQREFEDLVERMME